MRCVMLRQPLGRADRPPPPDSPPGPCDEAAPPRLCLRALTAADRLRGELDAAALRRPLRRGARLAARRGTSPAGKRPPAGLRRAGLALVRTHRTRCAPAAPLELAARALRAPAPACLPFNLVSMRTAAVACALSCARRRPLRRADRPPVPDSPPGPCDETAPPRLCLRALTAAECLRGELDAAALRRPLRLVARLTARRGTSPAGERPPAGSRRAGLALVRAHRTRCAPALPIELAARALRAQAPACLPVDRMSMPTATVACALQLRAAPAAPPSRSTAGARLPAAAVRWSCTAAAPPARADRGRSLAR